MKFRAVFLALAIVFLWQNQERIERWVNPPEPLVIHPEHEVVLFATAWCGYCAKTRAILAEHQVRYFEYDIEKSAEGQQKFDALNGMGVPLLVVRDQVIRGYSEPRINAALKAL